MNTLNQLIEERLNKILDEFFQWEDEIWDEERGKQRHFIDLTAEETTEFVNELKESLLSQISSLIDEVVKEIVPEEDNTPDANEYERADRIAWNQCRQQTLDNWNKMKGV